MSIAVILCAVLFLAVSLLPYPQLKILGDAVSKDGSLEILNPRVYAQIHLPVLAFAVVLLVAGVFMLLRADLTWAFLDRLRNYSRQALIQLKRSTLVLLRDVRAAFPPKRDILILTFIVLLAVFLRLVLINRGMEYDEAYTFSEFARHSFRQVITDYHVPNNHVFHTILVHLSYLVFGNHPWALRLPAFLAGIGLVVAVYALARQTVSNFTGWVAASGVAVLPVLVFYSVNARGYTLICLWSVLLLLLCDYVRKHRNPAAWALMVLVTGLGFFTIPIMLYPFGIAITWLFLSGLYRDISPEYDGLKGWLAALAGFGICAALFTILLYAPIFQANGIRSVFNGNRVVESLPLPEFFSKIPFQGSQALREFTVGELPHWVLLLLLVGFVFSILIHRRIASQRVPFQLAALLFLVPAILIQRPILLARVWLYLLPLLIFWGTAGLLGLVQILLRPVLKRLYVLQGIGAVLLLLAFVSFGWHFIAPYLENPDWVAYPPMIDAELVTRYFQAHLKEGDVVVVSNDEDAQYWYYFDAYRIPEVHIRGIKERPFRHAYIISHPNPRREIEAVISQFGPDLGFFRMDTLKPVIAIRDTLIYEVWPFQDVVDDAFGVKP